jgi:hypothetical protein
MSPSHCVNTRTRGWRHGFAVKADVASADEMRAMFEARRAGAGLRQDAAAAAPDAARGHRLGGVLLASPDADWVNGQVLRASGGVA